MKTELCNVCNAIEDVLEINGVKSVELRENLIRVTVANGRAFAKLFPNKEERICKDANSVCPTVEANTGCFVFQVLLTKRDYEEFKNMYGVTEIGEVEE